MCVHHLPSPLENARGKVELTYSGYVGAAGDADAPPPPPSRLIQSMLDCDPSVRALLAAPAPSIVLMLMPMLTNITHHSLLTTVLHLPLRISISISNPRSYSYSELLFIAIIHSCTVQVYSYTLHVLCTLYYPTVLV